MTHESYHAEHVFPCTTWRWVLTRVEAGAHPQGTAHPQDGRSRFAVPRSRRSRVALAVHYRGGPESSWLVTYNGRSVRIPGWLCMEDAMRQVLGETPVGKRGEL